MRPIRSGHREINLFGRMHGLEPAILGGDKPKEPPKAQPGGGGGGIAPPKKQEMKLRVVEDSTDRPIAGVEIILTRKDGWKGVRTTDANGEIVVKGVQPADSYSATCKLEGRQLKNSLYYVGQGVGVGNAARVQTYQDTEEKNDFVIANLSYYKVREGDTLESVAKANGMTYESLTMFNFGTSARPQVNDHLRTDVGCMKKGDDGQYQFSNSDKPGFLFIPNKWQEGSLGAGDTTFRVRKSEKLPKEDIPIIMVPGVMASRLHQPGKPSEPLWDPDDSLSMLSLARMPTTQFAERMDILNEVEVFKDHPDREKHHLTDVHIQRGWAGLSQNFYGLGLHFLEDKGLTDSRISGRTHVYGFGYDWRLSNRRNGQLLQELIKKVKNEHGKKPLIVTHSMGGLVTRAACAQGAASDIVGVVHTMQPATGAPVLYRRFKTGANDANIFSLPDWVLEKILGDTPLKFQLTLAGTLGPFELLPNQSYTKTTGQEGGQPPGPKSVADRWLTWDDKIQVAVTPASNIYDIYGEDTGKIGLCPFATYAATPQLKLPDDTTTDGPTLATKLRRGIKVARKFWEDYDSYVHPNTSVVASTGLKADTAVKISLETKLIRHGGGGEFRRPPTRVESIEAIPEKPAFTDSTVPLSSSTALPLSASDRQKVVSGVPHADGIAQSGEFRDAMWEACIRVLREAGVIK